MEGISDAHTIAGLLKLWFRELPEPVLIFRYYTTFVKVMSMFHILPATVVYIFSSLCSNFVCVLTFSSCILFLLMRICLHAENPDEQKAKINLRLLIHGLPEANKSLTFYLCSFLREVAEHASLNKMSSDNLAMVFAPNLLRTEVAYRCVCVCVCVCMRTCLCVFWVFVSARGG